MPLLLSPQDALVDVVKMESGGTSSSGASRSMPLLANTTWLYREPLYCTDCSTARHQEAGGQQRAAPQVSTPLCLGAMRAAALHRAPS